MEVCVGGCVCVGGKEWCSDRQTDRQTAGSDGRRRVVLEEAREGCREERTGGEEDCQALFLPAAARVPRQQRSGHFLPVVVAPSCIPSLSCSPPRPPSFPCPRQCLRLPHLTLSLLLCVCVCVCVLKPLCLLC